MARVKNYCTVAFFAITEWLELNYCTAAICITEWLEFIIIALLLFAIIEWLKFLIIALLLLCPHRVARVFIYCTVAFLPS